MLTDGVFYNLTILCHSIKFDFIGFLHKLTDYHRIFLAHL